LASKQEVVPCEGVGILPPSLCYGENILKFLGFRIIQFLEIMISRKGMSFEGVAGIGVAGGHCSAVSGRCGINSNASSDSSGDARLCWPVCDLNDLDNFAVAYVFKEGFDACVTGRWKDLGNILDASGRNADIHEQNIAVPTSAVDQLRAPTV